MSKYQGTIVENSLADTSVLSQLKVLKSWSSGKWKLHRVTATKEQVRSIGTFLADGPWYIHFWADNREDVVVVFKEKIFFIKHSDKSTWKEAVSYGKLLGIPEEQLDFLIDQ